MNEIVFKDCEYRFINDEDKLSCKNKQDKGKCDNCKSNTHLNCDNYNPKKDICLKFFEFGVSEVSQYDTCQEKTVFNDKELSRKWSN